MVRKAFQILLLSLALSASWASTQAEPSMAEVYAAAQAGQMDKAQTMIQQVLVSHPNSAKAHYVRAELFAREGKARLAQESLQEAEHLSPGLHFAKPEAVNALRTQISELASHANTTRSVAYATPAPSTPQGGSNTVMWILLVGGVVLIGFWVLRPRQQTPVAAGYPSASPSGQGLTGPHTFGQAAGTAYPSPAPEPGMGSRIMGGVATGLAVGAGVMAAEAIGRRLMEHDDPVSRGHDISGHGGAGNDFTPLNTHVDMGGDNFGVADGGWDDGGDAGSGSDWDN